MLFIVSLFFFFFRNSFHLLLKRWIFFWTFFIYVCTVCIFFFIAAFLSRFRYRFSRKIFHFPKYVHWTLHVYKYKQWENDSKCGIDLVVATTTTTEKNIKEKWKYLLGFILCPVTWHKRWTNFANICIYFMQANKVTVMWRNDRTLKKNTVPITNTEIRGKDVKCIGWKKMHKQKKFRIQSLSLSLFLWYTGLLCSTYNQMRRKYEKKNAFHWAPWRSQEYSKADRWIDTDEP